MLLWYENIFKDFMDEEKSGKPVLLMLSTVKAHIVNILNGLNHAFVNVVARLYTN